MCNLYLSRSIISPHVEWLGGRDSNPRLAGCKPGALAAELPPKSMVIISTPAMRLGREDLNLHPSAHEAATLPLRHGPVDSYPAYRVVREVR